jgi:hypothetical protein
VKKKSTNKHTNKVTKQVSESIKTNMLTIKVQLYLDKKGNTDEEKKKYTNAVWKDLRALEKATYISNNKLMTRSFIIHNETLGLKGEEKIQKIKDICSVLSIEDSEYKTIKKDFCFYWK